MRTIHIIFNAHIDPIWLWPWQSGLDEVLATCRSACDRLDNNPELTFTRGESWVYEQIERIDPSLFERIRTHINNGRWHIIGGWYVQPDCNLPSGFGFEKQIEIGKRYFENRFNYFPPIAYNVDSFGHAATLPKLMRDAGQEFYVMLRPGAHEMDLPARIFRWRGTPDGPEVIVFRIAGGYASSRGMTAAHCERSLTELPEGIDDTMCFAGIGDHGGGPTEEMIQWCRDEKNSIKDATLEFSSAQAFFEKIKAQKDKLPLVVGELQHHAIGCYTAYRPVKVGVRKGEHMAVQAGIALEKDPAPEADAPKQLEEAWRRVCFHHFHDTHGGTCLASAYEIVDAQLGQSAAICDEIMHYSLRRQLNAFPDDSMQRMAFFNASDKPFDGYVEFEPWLDFEQWKPHWALLDENGKRMHCQKIDAEACIFWPARILLRLKVEPKALRVLRIDKENKSPEVVAEKVHGLANSIETHAGIKVDLNKNAMQLSKTMSLPLPRLDLIEDDSDTWSHGIDSYAEGPAETPQWQAPALVDEGPLVTSIIQEGSIGNSSLNAEWRVYSGESFVELLLRIHWKEARRILKFTLTPEQEINDRFDGIPGGSLQRTSFGREVPIHDYTLANLSNGTKLGVVAPDVYALDGKPHRIRMTLLRSPLFAHHVPPVGLRPTTELAPPINIKPRQRFTDQGEHLFRFKFFDATTLTVDDLEEQAYMYHRPLVAADLTRGMPTRLLRGV